MIALPKIRLRDEFWYYRLQPDKEAFAEVIRDWPPALLARLRHVIKLRFGDFQIVQPPRALLDRFSAIVAPSFRLIYKLHLQIQNLRRTRDLLLPRLLSGQVELKTGNSYAKN